MQQDIKYVDQTYFDYIEKKHPGSLLNNCSYPLWDELYVQRDRKVVSEARKSISQKKQSIVPLEQQLPASGPKLSDSWNHISDWIVRVHANGRDLTLMGCMEDIKCTASQQQSQHQA